jgi:hypothetical protein
MAFNDSFSIIEKSCLRARRWNFQEKEKNFSKHIFTK